MQRASEAGFAPVLALEFPSNSHHSRSISAASLRSKKRIKTHILFAAEKGGHSAEKLDRSTPLRSSVKVLVLFHIAALVTVLSSRARAGQIGFPLIASYSNDNIGSDAPNYCITQGPEGELYFGSNGLLTFDGERWTVSTTPGLRSVFGIERTADGKIWIAADSELGWFDRTHGRAWKYHSLLSQIPSADIPHSQLWQVFAGNDGVVFVGSDHVYRWDGKKMLCWSMPGVRRIAGFKIGGVLYLHYRRQGLLRMSERGPEVFIPQSSIGPLERGIMWIDPAPDGWLLATNDGLFKFQNGECVPFAPEASRLLRNTLVTCGARLGDGSYAFGTLKGGIVFVDRTGNLLYSINETDGLSSSYITALFVDKDKDLWATSPSQIFRIEQNKNVQIFDQRAGLATRSYEHIAQTDDGLTIANDMGLFRLNSGTRKFNKLPTFNNGIHDIIGYQYGILIAGFRGAWIERGGVVSPLYSSQFDVQTALPSRVLSKAILLSEDTNPAIICINEHGSQEKIVERLPAAATSLAEDSAGKLWMGTDTKGVFVANIRGRLPTNAKAVQAPTPSGWSGKAVVRDFPDGTIVVLTDNGAWFRSRASTTFHQVENYIVRPIAAVSNRNPDGSLWIVNSGTSGSPSSVGRILETTTGIAWLPQSVAGLASIGTPKSILAERDQGGGTSLWIGGTNSVIHCATPAVPQADTPLRPLLHVYTPQDGSTAEVSSGSFPYSTKAIEFEFSDPDYAHRAQIRLQTRILGIDSDWLPSAADSRRELTALREGKYTFQVRALAETGIASEPTTFSFEVLPPWWRTRTAMALSAVFLGVLAYGGYRLRVRTLSKRNAELEKKVQERTEELAEASAAKTMFVANMSHDIRNPLNGIVGLALALEETKLDTKQREIVATLRECTNYLSTLVDDVLDFASIEAGRFELRPGPFVPADLLNSIVTALRGQASDKNAFITIETDPDLPPMLRGDAGRIQQILVNYLSNAIKYAGGHIRVVAAVAPSSPGEVEFYVADEGPGISEDETKTLFTKFSRLEGARRDNVKGTGLGLASCRALADAMGGSVGVESKIGEGTRFFLRLPLTVATEPQRVSPDAAIPNTTVLLVEDTDYNALAATAVLAKLGLTCDRAKNGEEAIRLFSEKRHNVVLLDRNLPDMDGTEVARRMRELETDGLQAVLLAVTAYCTAEDRDLCLKSGMDAFVGKPLTPEKLRRVLIDAASRMLGSASIEAPSETVPASAPTPTIDTTLLEYLADGTAGGLAAQAERFIAALDEAHQELLTIHASGDLDAIANAAHRVLGHARMVGCASLTDAATAVETAARRQDATAIDRGMPTIAREVAALTATLRRPGVPKA